MRAILAVTAVMLAACACRAAAAETDVPRPVIELPEIRELPDPFTFIDRSPVRTPDDWARRREEIKSLCEDYVYGHLPPRPEKMTVSLAERIEDAENRVTIEELVLDLADGGNAMAMPLTVALPADVTGPVPVIVYGTFDWRRFTPPAGGPAQEPPPGARFATYARRGYAVAEFRPVGVAADDKEQARTSGVYELFGGGTDCGALMAWAWGMHRAIDAIEGMGQIDSRKVVVTGHSRYGKAALLAGAFDERIALTVPSHSGCAGAAPYRFIYGNSEQLHNIVGGFPHWFRPDFNRFVGNVNRLPVDQHLLLALVAPRALLMTEGTEDTWTNPEGSQLTYMAARQVYDFLGASERISVRFRPVGHIPSVEDLLDFADHTFFGKPLPDGFGQLPYAHEEKAFTWNAPR